MYVSQSHSKNNKAREIKQFFEWIIKLKDENYPDLMMV